MVRRFFEVVDQKADRLKNNCRVILIGHREALVIGDHDTYFVTRPNSSWCYSCRWGRHRGHFQHCAHVTAARRALKDPQSQVPVARLADLLIDAAPLEGIH